jgi:hypothetical protein
MPSLFDLAFDLNENCASNHDELEPKDLCSAVRIVQNNNARCCCAKRPQDWTVGMQLLAANGPILNSWNLVRRHR